MAYAVREIVASAARTTTGDSGAVRVGGAVELGQVDTVALFLSVTAVSGTPSMTLSVEWSPDGVTFGPADVADAFAAITTAVARAKTFEVKMPFYRAVWTISGGTPSLTFTVHEWADVD